MVITQPTNRRLARRRPKTHPKILGPLDSSSANQQDSPLFSLPPELRLLIWEYALTSPTGELEYHLAAARFDSSTIGAGLFTTCHQVALETLYLPLRLNVLAFGNPLVSGSRELEFGYLRFWARMSDIERKIGCLFRFKKIGLFCGEGSSEELKRIEILESNVRGW